MKVQGTAISRKFMHLRAIAGSVGLWRLKAKAHQEYRLLKELMRCVNNARYLTLQGIGRNYPPCGRLTDSWQPLILFNHQFGDAPQAH
jgi:hypothetical protein